MVSGWDAENAYASLTSTELHRPLFLARVGIYRDDLGALLRSATLKNGESDASDTEDGDIGVLCGDGVD